jgi:hypothetical protein
MRKLCMKDGNNFMCSIMLLAMWCALLATTIVCLIGGFVISKSSLVFFSIFGLIVGISQVIIYHRKVANHYSDLCNTGVYDD